MRLGRLQHPILFFRRIRVLPGWVRRIDRGVNRRLNAAAGRRWPDPALRRLSRAADHGRLWFGLAGALVLVGRPRAALRGVASLALASAAANLIGKRIFGGKRPVWKDVPTRRRLRAYPTSASFPSGHSASAAAFATGVAVESPTAGALLAPVAGSVAYSRLHVGAHWVSDVIGGIALGVGIAAAASLIIPPRRGPREDTPITGSGTRTELPSPPGGEDVLLVLNPSAGTSVIRPDPRPRFEERLPAARVEQMSEDRSLDDIVGSAVAEGRRPRVLAVYGGDGSVSRAAHLARSLEVPLLAMPGGTFNHFVRAVGVESVDAGLDAFSSATGVRVGVASLHAGEEPPITVLNTAAIGIYPDFVAERDTREERWGKWLAGARAALVVLRRAEPIDVELDGERMRVWSLFASVGRNDPGRVSTMQRRTLEADVLDVRILHARGSRIRAFGSLAFGRRSAAVLRALHLGPDESDVERRLVTEVTLRVRTRDGEAVPYVHDGELESEPPVSGDGYELRLAAHPNALGVYVP